MKLFLIALILILTVSTVSYAEEMAIIANKGYPANHISLATLREIYLGEKVTEDTIRIKPYDQKSTKIRRKFLSKVLGLSEDRYSAYWIKKVFQEGGAPPLAKMSSEEVIRSIREEVGGVGYIWKHEADNSQVKVLLTIDVGE